MEENRLLKDNLPSLFIGYVLPAVIAMVLSGIQGMIDGIFLGNYAGSNVTASRGIICIFIGILVLPQFMEINGVWASIPFAEIVTIVLCGILMIKNRKLFFHDENPFLSLADIAFEKFRL